MKNLHIYRKLFTRPDYVKSARLFSSICNGKTVSLIDACYWLGGQYEKGLGVQKDIKQALKLYERACEGNVQSSCQDYNELLRSIQ